MKSTGECLVLQRHLTKLFTKAFLGAGVVLPKHKKIIISVKDADKQEVVPLAQRFEKSLDMKFMLQNYSRCFTKEWCRCN